MLKMQLKTVAAIAAVMMAGHVFADYTSGTVSGLTAKQRYPWNGLVDISFTLSGPERGYCVAVTATNSATSEAIPVRTLRDRAGNAITRRTEFAPGTVSLVWDAGTDVPNTLIEALALSVAPPPPDGQLWAGGPIWAEKNVGAEVPEDYGLYFWWGDTVGCRREGSAWVASDGSSQNFQFYDDPISRQTYGKSHSTLQSEGWVVSTNGTYVLAPEHDAAHVHWGGNWRMPTEDEISALNRNCDWTWTTRNGVNGYVVRGRGDYSEASIFLPAAGFGNGTSLYDAGSAGFYWSSVSFSDNYGYYSWSLDFNSRRPGSGCNYCYCGQPVRPVQGFAE